MITITITLIIITCLVSISGFSSEKIINDLIFYPPSVSGRKQYYRFITCGLIHADFGHLAFNMLSLYMFGDAVERISQNEVFPSNGKFIYLFMYLSALVVSLLPTYLRNRDNQFYRSLGASGAVSAVVFAGILLFPTAKIGLFIIPPIIPGFIFGPIYLIISAFLEKRGQDNINHSAHIWGAIYGVVFMLIASKLTGGADLIQNFVLQVTAFFK
jgi:membrane associated rhomboid family serine protease